MDILLWSDGAGYGHTELSFRNHQFIKEDFVWGSVDDAECRLAGTTIISKEEAIVWVKQHTYNKKDKQEVLSRIERLSV